MYFALVSGKEGVIEYRTLFVLDALHPVNERVVTLNQSVNGVMIGALEGIAAILIDVGMLSVTIGFGPPVQLGALAVSAYMPPALREKMASNSIFISA